VELLSSFDHSLIEVTNGLLEFHSSFWICCLNRGVLDLLDFGVSFVIFESLFNWGTTAGIMELLNCEVAFWI
jgi:hypothetical protein